MNYIIRPIQYYDYEDLYKIWSDKFVTDLSGTVDGMSIDDSRVRVERTMQDPNTSQYIAEVPGVGVIGLVALVTNYSRKKRHLGSISIMVRSDFHHKGIGQALFQKILDVADNHLKLGVLELDCFTDNTNAINLYLKYGFEIEGTLRKRMMRNGAIKDIFMMSRINEQNLKLFEE